MVRMPLLSLPGGRRRYCLRHSVARWAACVLLALALAGCRMAHVEVAKQQPDTTEQPVGPAAPEPGTPALALGGGERGGGRRRAAFHGEPERGDRRRRHGGLRNRGRHGHGGIGLPGGARAAHVLGRVDRGAADRGAAGGRPGRRVGGDADRTAERPRRVRRWRRRRPRERSGTTTRARWRWTRRSCS